MGFRMGDYVHWKYYNYLNHGISTSDISQRAKPFHALNLQKQMVINEAKSSSKNRQQIKTYLENNLNFYFNRKQPNQIKVDGLTNEQIHKKIIKCINEKFNGKAVITDTLSTSFLPKTLDKNFKRLVEDGYSGNSVGAIYNRILLLLEYQKNLTDELRQDKKIADWEKNFKEFTKDYQAMINMVKNREEEFAQLTIDKDTNLATSFYQRKTYVNDYGTADNTKAGFIHSLNQLIDQIKKASDSYYTGLAGEYYAALCFATAQAKTEYEIDNILQQFLDGVKFGLVGDQRSASVINIDNLGVTGASRKKLIDNKQYYITNLDGTSDNQLKLVYTQDKVDLQLTFNDEENIPISIKNYNLADANTTITLLSGANLLVYLQDYGEFVSHYLNLVAEVKPDDEQKDYSSERFTVPAQLIKLANQTLLFTLGLKAIRGNVNKIDNNGNSVRSIAEFFVVNNNATGGYKVYFIDEIINLIGNNISRIENYLAMDDFNLSTRFSMKWGKTLSDPKSFAIAYYRINGLMQQLQDFKIHVMLKQNALRV